MLIIDISRKVASIFFLSFFFFSCKLWPDFGMYNIYGFTRGPIKECFSFWIKEKVKKMFFPFHFNRRADSGADSQTKSCMYVYIYAPHPDKNRSKSRSSIRMKVYYLLKQNRFHESFNVMIGKTLGGKPGNYHAIDDRNVRFKQSRNGPRWKTDGCYLRRWYYKGSSASFADTKSFFGLQNHFAESSKTEAADFPFGKMSFALLAETVVYNCDKYS